ncbi:MAG: hypothetical protein HZA80_02970 [Candidatus Taylorbacteria bacterium]|nr:hypothetical protein [Candidatus Taylorbacteria bacterium]
MKFFESGLQICGSENPHFWIFDFSTAPSLLFYSYIPILILSVVLGIYILIKDNSLKSRLFVGIAFSFSLWILNILVQWVASYHSILMFAWQLTALFEIAIFVFTLLFIYVIAYERQKLPYPLIWSVLIGLGLLAVALPTSVNILEYDITECQGNTGILWNLIYVLESVLVTFTAIIGLRKFQMIRSKNIKKEGLILTIGATLFLFGFFLSNFAGELTKIYEFNLWGPIGMLVFLLVLAYSIVRFKLFVNPKIFATEFLVFILALLVFSLFFIEDSSVFNVILSATVILVIILGAFLIRSVLAEVQQRERIEKLASDLKKANNHLLELDKQKSEFVSFATHQLKSPLAAMRGYASLILDGDYGEISAVAREPLSRIFESTKTLANVVEGYLNISRIELGTMKYDFAPHDIRAMVSDVIAELEPNTKKAGITLKFNVSTEDEFIVNADPDKLKQVFANLIDNSVKYTPTGSVTVSLEKKHDAIKGNILLFSVKDTGIGMSEKTIASLFQKFTRAYNANKTNIHGTGLGLFVAKEIVTAHKGRVWAESEGEGKGSQFYVELPSVK